MKAKILPLFFNEANPREKQEFDQQMQILDSLYHDEADFFPAQSVEQTVPADVDAVLFPQMFGAIFSHQDELVQIKIPIIVLTSSFGTVEMWDWEIVSYLREQLKLNVFTPYNIDLAKIILRALAVKSNMSQGLKFLMFQDSPGEGMQANIFKRFYWWEEECTDRIQNSFGIEMVYQSWKEINLLAQKIPDDQARKLWNERKVPIEDLSDEKILKAVKIYMAVKARIDEIGGVAGVGSNCLNESFLSETTPCLAWNWMFEHDHIIWACEGDTVTLISAFIFYSALHRPLMMTNIYPFLVGMAALKHEKIDKFPEIDDPDNHALGVHCGYFGLAPQSFCTNWVLRPKVLEIVNENAVMIDCRMQTGDVTLAKLHADMKHLTIIEAEIEDYAQYAGSDCRNGALLRYKNKSGHRVMEKLSSHHAIIIQGSVAPQLQTMAKIFNFEVEVI